MTTEVKAAAEERIARLIGGITKLPTPPVVFTQIQKVLNNPNNSAYDIAAILQEDPAISAQVLKITNSAYYGLSRPVDSVKQAVIIVGLDSIKNLVLSVSVVGAFKGHKLDQEYQDYFWRHSLGVALAARVVGYKVNGANHFDPEGGFSAGLLHDIGKMVIAVYMSDQFEEIKNVKQDNPGVPEYLIEEKIIGCSHADIGALLAGQWKLSEKLVDAIRYHHFPESSEIENSSMPYQINIADYLSKYTFEYDPEQEQGPPDLEPLSKHVLDYAGVTQEQANGLTNRIREEFFKSETFLELTRAQS